ncbi:hypothetical protein AAC387_Pa01g2108 [Persea americana]
MVGSKIVINQVQDLQVTLNEIDAEGMSLSESFQVAAIIETLPPLWKDFKNYLKHKRKEIKLEDLIIGLRIEEDNSASKKKAGKTFTKAKANSVEQGQKPKMRKNFGNCPKQGPNDNKKFKGICYMCDKPSHHAKDCRKCKDQGNTSKKPSQANMTELDTLSNDVSDINLFVVVSEVNLVHGTKEWWVDTGATHHVCSNKEMFSFYHASTGEQLFMGNSATSKVEAQ